ncbi:MAG: YCF48-related protein [Ignavibacteria bacterium]
MKNKIMIVTSTRRIVKTTDAGPIKGTDTVPGSTNNTLTDIDFKNANTGYVTGNANYFGVTTDGGATWTQQVTPFGAIGQRASEISGNDVYTVGDYTVLYKTTDDGLLLTTINFIDGSNPYQPSPFNVRIGCNRK